LDAGLIRVVNPEAARLDWALQVAGHVWDALRGDSNARPAAWVRYHPRQQLPALSDLILDAELRARLSRLPCLLADGPGRAFVGRGPRHNGRRTLLAAVAAAAGRGVLEVDVHNATEAWPSTGPLATLLGAMPVVELDPAPGESVTLPALRAYRGPIGIAI